VPIGIIASLVLCTVLYIAVVAVLTGMVKYDQLDLVLAGCLPIDALLHLTNIGTLFAFVVVCAAVLIIRRRYPDHPRPFRCPFVPVVPILGVLTCLLLMFSLPVANWWRLFVWLGIGLCIYFFYGQHHSVLTRPSSAAHMPGGKPKVEPVAGR